MKLKPWQLVLACAVLLVLRKPWALHTPQLWAEDGSIFLTQDEQMGVRAWGEPYNGYLHLLPRLIAWVASHLADPAWWPAIYNGLAFAITVGLFVRLASPRVELPGKPWLMLAFVGVVGTGEVLINVTNLQWVTVFFLVAQLFTTRPAGNGERLGDLALLFVIGLNGPFALLLLPFFAWRVWRDRHTDAWLAFAVIGTCAVVQTFFLRHVGPSLENPGAAFQPLNLLSVVGCRLVLWPIFGPAPVHVLPTWAYAAAALALLGPLLVWTLRADALRPQRVMIAALFILITAAGIYRARVDTWVPWDMTQGDRYFYIPRVLLAWLLIWEFHARPRVVAWVARGLCVLALANHLPRFVLPAPPDYQWAAHCDPIRRGVPAKINTLPEGWWIDYPGRPPKP